MDYKEMNRKRMELSWADLTEEVDVKEHVDDVEHLVHTLLVFHQRREDTYQMSFAKRGLVGAFFNLARKYDRLDQLGEDFFNKGSVPGDRQFVDTLIDTAIYAVKILALLGRLESLHFEEGPGLGVRRWSWDTLAKELDVTPDFAEAMLKRGDRKPGYIIGNDDNFEERRKKQIKDILDASERSMK